ncbi:MAG: reverse transcriptase domain-containing protein [Clostridium sp.]
MYIKKVIEIFKCEDKQIIEKFNRLDLREDVSKILEIDDQSLRYFLYVKKTENMYTSFKIVKKNGEFREINAPNNEMKNIQKKLAYILNLVYRVKPCVYGFVKDKNIKDNAKNHNKKRMILNIDLKDFFTQIHFGRIRGMLMKPPYSIGQEAATVIAQIACYRGVLPQGSPSSPILTNMICSPLDTQLTNLAKRKQLIYTRYADDITFSTFNRKFSKTIVNGDMENLMIGKELENILLRNSFNVNPKKIFLNSLKTRQEVNGLVVNKFPNIKREYIKKIRAILYNSFNNGLEKTAKDYIRKGYCKNKEIVVNIDNERYAEKIYNWFKAVLKGKISFIREIRGEKDYIYLKYAQQLNKLYNEKIFNIDSFEEIINNVVILESENEDVQGSGFFVKDLGLFTNYHVTEDLEFYNVKTHLGKCVGKVAKVLNEINCDKSIDYALYALKNEELVGLELADSLEINIGDKVIIIGYPEYNEKDSPHIQTCAVTSRTSSFGSQLYTVSGRIVHGASGGVVLNLDYRVIGIIKAGISTINEVDEFGKQGFVSIERVLTHMNESKIKEECLV